MNKCWLLAGISFFFLTAVTSAQVTNIHVHYPELLQKMMKQDSAGKLFISSVVITGNRRTNQKIILREMQVKTGDSLSTDRLFDLLQESRDLIYNTNLFSQVDIKVGMPTPYTLQLSVIVIERIYLIPSPEFRLSDRNLNEWWTTYHADLSRITYGIKLRHTNLTGNGDRLSLFALNGFSRLISLQYQTPYVNADMTKGLSVGMTYARQREMICNTNYDNQVLVYRKNAYVNESFTFQATYTLRKGYYNRHQFHLHLQSLRVEDSLLNSRYNPDYFNEPGTQWVIPEISYTYQYLHTDNVNYPMKGTIIQTRIAKKGFGWKGGINALTMDASVKWYTPIYSTLFFTMQSSNRIRLPFMQAYINRQAFGYGDYYLRGLEFKVIDAVASSLNRFTIIKKVLDKKIRIPIKNRYIPYLPVKIFIKSYTDIGYAYDLPEHKTRLSNAWLYTGGVGADVLSLYDIRTSIEYSFNQLGEKGLFLHLYGIF